jgi:hypothetical protein
MLKALEGFLYKDLRDSSEISRFSRDSSGFSGNIREITYLAKTSCAYVNRRNKV